MQHYCEKCKQVIEFAVDDAGKLLLCPNDGEPFCKAKEATPPRTTIKDVMFWVFKALAAAALTAAGAAIYHYFESSRLLECIFDRLRR